MKSDWTTKKFSEIANFNPKESIPKEKITKKVAVEKLQPFYRDIPGFPAARSSATAIQLKEVYPQLQII